MPRIAVTAAVVAVLCFVAPARAEAEAETEQALKVITDAGSFLEPYSGDVEKAESVNAAGDAACTATELVWQVGVRASCLDKDHQDDKIVCVWGDTDCSIDDVCNMKNGCGYATDETDAFFEVTGYACSASTGTTGYKGTIGCTGHLTGLSIFLIILAVLLFCGCCCGCAWCMCKK